MAIDLPRVFTDPDGREFELTGSTWSHIALNHGEVIGNIEEIESCIGVSEDIFRSTKNKHRIIYRSSPDNVDYRYFVVVVDERTNQIVTAYATNHDSF